MSKKRDFNCLSYVWPELKFNYIFDAYIKKNPGNI